LFCAVFKNRIAEMESVQFRVSKRIKPIRFIAKTTSTPIALKAVAIDVSPVGIIDVASIKNAVIA
jgi:hypothetical protein